MGVPTGSYDGIPVCHACNELHGPGCCPIEQNLREREKEEKWVDVKLRFSPQAYAKLLEIRAKAGTDADSEIVRNALRLYEWYLGEVREGSKLQIRKEDGVVSEIEIEF